MRMGDKQNAKNGKKGKGKASSSHKGLNGSANAHEQPMVGRGAMGGAPSPTSPTAQSKGIGAPQATPPSTPELSPIRQASLSHKLYTTNKLSSPPIAIRHYPRTSEGLNGPPNVVDTSVTNGPNIVTTQAQVNMVGPSSGPDPSRQEMKESVSNRSLSSSASISSSSVESAQSVRLREAPGTPVVVRPKAFNQELNIDHNSSPGGSQATAGQGQGSPGNNSLISNASAVTNASVITIATPSDCAGMDGRQRLTLGEIITQIETRCRTLLRKDDFNSPDTVQDMQFLAHQSRYSSDMNIKRRLIAKLIENGLLEIFVKVFHSAHSIDYLAPKDGGSHDSKGQSVEDVSSETKSLDGRCMANGTEPSSDSVSMRSVDINDGVEMPHDPRAFMDKYPNASDALKNLRAAITLMWNATDKSPHLCEDCIRRGVIRLLLEDLTDPRLAASELKDQNKLYLVKGYLGILYNLIRYYNDTRDMFRDLGAVKVLQQFLKSSLLMVKTKTIMLLTYLVNESENDIINATDKNLGFVTKMLQSTLESENHFSKKYGYWAVEVAAAVNRLASCESNKERLLKKGVLPHYLRLLEACCSEEEQLIATQGLWMFSFWENNRKILLEDRKCTQALEGLVKTSAREEIRRAAKGTLWVLQGGHMVRHHRPSESQREAGHVMISYQWAAKHVLLKIRDRLKTAGYKVWMDADNMIGSSLESSIEAVDKSSVVLVCMTQKYKDSPSCRTEAEYASRQRHDILPLRIQPKYNPDGWLGRLIGTKMYFDFSREEHQEVMMSNLIRELGRRGHTQPDLPPDAAKPPLPPSSPSLSIASRASQPISHQLAVHPATPPTLPANHVPSQSPHTANHVKHRTEAPRLSSLAERYFRLLNWGTDDVARWLKENELNSSVDKFKHINGELLVEIIKMQKSAPEAFYMTLRKELGFHFVATLKFTKALEKL